MEKNSLIGWTLITVLIVMMMFNMNKNKSIQEQKEAEAAKEKTEQQQTTTNTQNPAQNNGTATLDSNNQGNTAQPVYTSDSAKQAFNDVQYGIFANHVDGTESPFVVENDVLSITFSNKGGKPTSVILKDYKTHDGEPLEVFSTENGEFNLKSLAMVNKTRIQFETNDYFFQPTQTTDESGNKVISFKLADAGDTFYEHKFIIPASGYLIDYHINAQKLQNYLAQDYFVLDWAQRLNSLEGNKTTEKMYSGLYFANKSLNVDKIGNRKSTTKEPKTDTKWISYKQKFFSSVLIADDAPFDYGLTSMTSTLSNKEDDFIKHLSADIGIIYNKSDYYNFPMQMYFGPNDYKDLKAMDLNLQKTVQIGVSVFRWVNLFLIIPIFNFLNKFIGNYGIIILILTLLIKMIVFPFTFKSHLSMIKMRVLQPELAELKKKFGKDQSKMGPAQMELYRKAGVNPLGGCLPMLFQMPILIAMYRFFPSSLELRQQSFLWAKDLSTFDSIYSWSQEIPLLSQAYGNHISLFTILMAITSFFYTRINSQNTPTDPSNPMAAQMRMFQYIMPFMMLFIFNKFSAALSYYYFLFNLISVGQYYIMKKFMIDEDKIHAQIQANKKKVKTKSKWQQKMEEVLKQQEAAKKNRKK